MRCLTRGGHPSNVPVLRTKDQVGDDDEGQARAVRPRPTTRQPLGNLPQPGRCRCGVQKVTPQERLLIAAVARKWVDDGYPPTTRELMDGAGYRSSSTVWYHLLALKGRGYVEFEPTRKGTLRLTEKGWDASGYNRPCNCDLEPVVRELEMVIQRKDIRIEMLEVLLERNGIGVPPNTEALVRQMQEKAHA